MMVWTHQLSCCEINVLPVFNSRFFPSSCSMPRPSAYRYFSSLSYRCCTVVLKICKKVIFFIFVMPSETRRFKFTASWLCDDHTAAEQIVLRRSQHRAITAPSPRCRRTTVFKDLRYIYCLTRTGWRFADGGGYQPKEPINVSGVRFPIFFARRFPVWKRRTPLLYMFRLCGSPVSWDR
jgi:hypothetical protein